MNNDETGEGSIPHDLMTQSCYKEKEIIVSGNRQQETEEKEERRNVLIPSPGKGESCSFVAFWSTDCLKVITSPSSLSSKK